MGFFKKSLTQSPRECWNMYAPMPFVGVVATLGLARMRSGLRLPLSFDPALDALSPDSSATLTQSDGGRVARHPSTI